MAQTHVSVDEVKSTCDKLECSPSKSSKPAASGGKAKLIRNSGSAASGSTSDFGNGHGVPGYKGRFAPKAKQE